MIEQPPGGTWLLLVTPGSPQITDLPATSGIRLHGNQAWILLPPTPTITGTLTWINQLHDHFPHSLTAQWAARRALINTYRR